MKWLEIPERKDVVGNVFLITPPPPPLLFIRTVIQPYSIGILTLAGLQIDEHPEDYPEEYDGYLIGGPERKDT